MSDPMTTEHVGPEAQYRLTITGDAKMIRQIAGALELQSRLHLGQFQSPFHSEIIAGADPCPYIHEANEPAWHENDKRAVLDLLELLNVAFRVAEGIWQHKRSAWRDGHLYKQLHHSQRQQNAYSLWKGIAVSLAQAQGEKPHLDEYGVVPGRVTVKEIAEVADGKQEGATNA